MWDFISVVIVLAWYSFIITLGVVTVVGDWLYRRNHPPTIKDYKITMPKDWNSTPA